MNLQQFIKNVNSFFLNLLQYVHKYTHKEINLSRFIVLKSKYTYKHIFTKID